jgi:hypothetical protein
MVICISLMAKDNEYLLMDLLTICTCFENCLLNYFAYLLIELFVLLVFNFLSS